MRYRPPNIDETRRVEHIPLTQLLDIVIVRMRQTNGLDHCTFDQVKCLIEELQTGYEATIAKSDSKREDKVRTYRALIVRALFSHIAVNFGTPGGLYEVNATLPVLHYFRKQQGLPPMTTEQVIAHALGKGPV